MVTLHDLRSGPVALDWHEAVAVAAALVSWMIDAQAATMPEPPDVDLLPSGELLVIAPGQGDGAPAAAVAGLLGDLLESAPHPAQLRQLVSTYRADNRRGPIGQDALVSMMSDLAFFERPERGALLAAVAARAEPALERARQAAALEALMERTRLANANPPAAAPMPVPVPPEPHPEPFAAVEPPPAGAKARLAFPAVVALIVFLGMAYLVASWLAPPPAPAVAVEPADDPAPPPSPAPAPTPAPPRAATKGREAPHAPPAPAPQRTAAPPAPPARPMGRVRAAPTTAAVAPPTTRATPAAPPSVDVAIAEGDGHVVPSHIAPVGAAARAVPTGRVFTAADRQVTPAVLIRPKLPDDPPAGVPEEQVGTLEFVVAESGAVEHVRLIAPANRYQERMLVAAAKTWQFQPAIRDGRPVRYRTRIRVTL